MFPVFNSQQEYWFSLMQAIQGLVQQSGSTVVAGVLNRHAKAAALGRWALEIQQYAQQVPPCGPTHSCA